MKTDRSEIKSRRLPITGSVLFQAAVLALGLALALPAKAADLRAVKTRVAPVYPEIAKRMKIEGAVMVEVKVDGEGKVDAVKTVSGNRVLSAAARRGGPPLEIRVRPRPVYCRCFHHLQPRAVATAAALRERWLQGYPFVFLWRNEFGRLTPLSKKD